MHSHVADPPEWSIACSESILYFSTYYYYGINNYRLGIARDITRRKQAEEQLATRQAQLEEAQALARLGNWSWDIPSGTLNWSYEFYRRFGREPKERSAFCCWSATAARNIASTSHKKPSPCSG